MERIIQFIAAFTMVLYHSLKMKRKVIPYPQSLDVLGPPLVTLNSSPVQLDPWVYLLEVTCVEENFQILNFAFIHVPKCSTLH